MEYKDNLHDNRSQFSKICSNYVNLQMINDNY